MNLRSVVVNLVIAISGLHGTGKSTFAQKLAKEYGLRYFSTGQAFRELARERNQSIEEFTLHVEKHPEIDKELDNRALEEAKKGNVIIESQLAGWLTKDIADVKILLTAPFDIRIFRMMERDHKTREEILQETRKREASEKTRYQELYDIDITDLSIYDLVINTSRWSIMEIIEILKHVINLIMSKKK